MKIKKIIPNILTIIRIIVTPIAIYLGLKGNYKALAIMCIFVSLTDFLDGKLARKWHVCSELGAKLDSIADKILAIGLLIILILKNNIYFYILILEILITLVNVITFLRANVVESLLVGKIKTWFLFITLILGIVNIFFPNIHILMNIGIVLTLIFQTLSLIFYIRSYFLYTGKKKVLINLYKEYYNIVKDILHNKEFCKRKKYEHHYNESVYEHCLRVSFDAFCIAKKYKLDYKSVAIAGLLHDFYDKPWQDNNEKKPLLKKHGFVHAKEALKNSQKYFKEYMNDIIENSIERHMFPLNITPPKYIEGWLLVLIDKVDSIDFIIHPSAFIKCFINKKTK